MRLQGKVVAYNTCTKSQTTGQELIILIGLGEVLEIILFHPIIYMLWYKMRDSKE